MELPPFDILWQTSEKLSELESVLEELDRTSSHQKVSLRKRRRKHREGLYGVGFAIEDRGYYEPLNYCCDEAFYTDFEYETHLGTHVKCDFENCQFVSDSKLMRVHKEVVHDGGMFNKIYRTTSNKSILEWREARKRNYPTAERIAAQRELLQQRLSRGQIFKTPEFGALKRKRPAVLKAREVGTDEAASSSTVTLCTDSNKKTILDNGVTAAREAHSLVADGRIPALVAYDCSSGGSDSEPGIAERQKSVSPSGPEKGDTLEASCSTILLRGRRRRGGRRQRSKQLAKPQEDTDIKTNQGLPGRPAARERNPFTSHPVVRLQTKRRAQSANPDRILSRPTLLHMLLAEEMRTERNQLMQCIRYVINQNFFMAEPQK